MKAYIKATEKLRKSETLFVSVISPHKAVTSVTIAKWLAMVISLSGQTGTGGSVRSVSSSQAVARGANIETILEAGDWARVSTFRRFYYRAVPLVFHQSVIN